MNRILVVEDQPELRAAMGRALDALPNAVPQLTGSVREATLSLSDAPPRLVICDLDLPDGTGLDVLRVLDEMALHVPVLILSAWLDEYMPSLPHNPLLSVHQKPVTLRKLQSLALAAISESSQSRGPFHALDYVELAALGGFSLVIERIQADIWDTSAQLTVFEGELWCATYGCITGVPAARAIVALEGHQIRACPLDYNPGEREIDAPLTVLTQLTADDTIDQQDPTLSVFDPPKLTPSGMLDRARVARRLHPTSFTIPRVDSPGVMDIPPAPTPVHQPRPIAIVTLLGISSATMTLLIWLSLR